jgi:hypothetical protein
MNGDDDALDPKKNPLIGLEDEGFDLRTDEERERDEALFADHRALGRADQVEELARGLLAEGVDGRVEDGIRIMRSAEGKITVNGLAPGDVDDATLELLLELKVPEETGPED